MYPMSVDYPESIHDNFADFKAEAEAASDCLNFPISWTFRDSDDEDMFDDPFFFELVFLLPRKYGKTWSIRLEGDNFDREEIQTWIDTWLKGEVMHWYGWDKTND
jgi:hypothetical protein